MKECVFSFTNFILWPFSSLLLSDFCWSHVFIDVCFIACEALFVQWNLFDFVLSLNFTYSQLLASVCSIWAVYCGAPLFYIFAHLILLICLSRCHYKRGRSRRCSVHSAGPGVRLQSEEGHSRDSGSYDGSQCHQQQTGPLAEALQRCPVCNYRWAQEVGSL